MELLRSLPQTAPILLRHFAAYVDLAAEDLARAGRELERRAVAALVLGVGAFFAIAMGCLGVLALTWDTPRRLSAIVCMGCVFLALAAFGAVLRARARRDRARLARTRRQLPEILPEPAAAQAAAADAVFPRSRTMRALLDRRGLGVIAAVAAALLVSRPTLVRRMLGMLPLSAIARTLINRFSTTNGPLP